VVKFVQRLRVAGCRVDDSASDWRSFERFANLAALGRRPS
jgi:hypothetical protein